MGPTLDLHMYAVFPLSSVYVCTFGCRLSRVHHTVLCLGLFFLRVAVYDTPRFTLFSRGAFSYLAISVHPLSSYSVPFLDIRAVSSYVRGHSVTC